MIEHLKKYDGMVFTDKDWIKEKSSYNHNYYNGLDGDIIYALSDDDNLTEYALCVDDKKIWFAESFVSQGDVIDVYCDALLRENFSSFIPKY